MIRKILMYFVMLTASLMVIVTFVTATSYTQLAIAALLYPPLAYFVFIYNPHKTRGVYTNKSVSTPGAIETVNTLERDNEGVTDVDRRAFLRIIGAAGFSFFFFSIFAKRAEALFFGRAIESQTVSLEDAGGNKINPAERQPTDGYQISEVEEGNFIFCGFTNKNGAWFIMKQDGQTGSFRYAKGESDFPGNWANREQLEYDYFHNVFDKD